MCNKNLIETLIICASCLYIYTSIVVLTFAAWLPIGSAVSGFKGEQRPYIYIRSE